MKESTRIGVQGHGVPVTLIRTGRLHLREMETGDAAFILDLLNQPGFLQFIGDRGVRSVQQAATFIEERYRRSYRDHGYGLYVVADATDGTPMGMCGFVRRDTLPHADIGFALLPRYEGRGIAFEAASATLTFGRSTLGLSRILAVVQSDNVRSQRLLGRLGFAHSGAVALSVGEPALLLYASDA
ncbi:MAG TPA: GNAT family N-acetyltransferase [Gemmatimonadaceae bacterium]|nr:GNAT family N-acetyltransferase [Gemmatimonadaceae bacterium]